MMELDRRYCRNVVKIIFCLCQMAALSSAFVLPQACFRMSRAEQLPTMRLYASSSSGDQDDNEEKDLLEYFDPRISPHEYPNGIDPSSPPEALAASEEEEPDLLDYFDPRISPHEYPNGIDGTAKKTQEEEEEWNPLRFNNIQEDFKDTTRPLPPPSRPTSGIPAVALEGGPDKDLFDVFDPRISPHAYPDGIPTHSTEPVQSTTFAAFSYQAEEETTKATVKIGVLLIDHGSKRPKSNQHLETLAEVYNDTSPDHYIVRAAHMELASPTIEEGIRSLIEDEGVDQIVCHPYFLSPGRHVTEDIPELVAAAIEAVARPDIPITTTVPVGSSMEVMVGAISSIVDSTIRSTMEEQAPPPKKKRSSSPFLNLGN
mmetsp:Transcript_12910/g.23388  ORF Transcript_12910/g.23388 Transcript_12910/m.23388 type:complete len:372 (-) Transcript_12910:87-1202(-)|eukprot:CAMPEP_0198280554 /NCGR_PEP_ID=MMETSP1449-20131203/614_1 /TAXON_ID=420275 /ORGANISM="Attheya septentrionalis, Strain CCMP2084" /LENGTH=371 /DNA_ID=CAMNT_0043975951 /DNA_START=83 /DNA_END=1198 /DNA_ORIENTATION=-